MPAAFAGSVIFAVKSVPVVPTSPTPGTVNVASPVPLVRVVVNVRSLSSIPPMNLENLIGTSKSSTCTPCGTV